MSKKTQTREDVLALLSTFKENQKTAYALVSIGVFGSFARDEVRSDSDVDIVFETDKPNLFRTARMKQDLEELLGRNVDIVQLRESMNPRLRDRILREARYV